MKANDVWEYTTKTIGYESEVVMSAVKGLGEELFWEEVRRAREQDPVDKLLAGMRLHESACRVTLAGIRHQHPGISDADALAMLKARIAMKRKWDEVR